MKNYTWNSAEMRLMGISSDWFALLCIVLLDFCLSLWQIGSDLSGFGFVHGSTVGLHQAWGA